ncbi:thioesterase II family protein [Micromonospora sp. NPDC048868]|uniref:thioesterase II family protein n=1 Tax=Micromonospora sp. NPDC048868 TaxID=3364258 RepID=UPI003721EF69
MAQARSRWLIREPSPDAPARLFCFPYAGAGASSLRRWPDRIGSLEVCPVQLPGRERRIREQPYQDFASFAVDAVNGLRAYLDRPFVLFGQCMGALLAHAFAVRLAECGAPAPARLVVSASLAPHRGFYGLYHPWMSDGRLAAEIQRVLGVLGEGRMEPELLPLAIRVLRRDVQMCFDHSPAAPEPVSCPITAVAWRDDPDVSQADLRDWHQYGATDEYLLDGDTLTFLTAPPALLTVIEDAFVAATPHEAGSRGAR